MVFNTEKMKASMSQEDLELIIDAILNGKYSWACVLILNNAGYEPGHYIPYRTLNRLIKENGFPNCHAPRASRQPRANQKTQCAVTKGIRDLNFLEPSAKDAKKVKGGHFAAWKVVGTGIQPMGAY